MLRPNGAHLFIGRKLAALGLRESFVKRSLFLSSQWNHRFIVTGQLQEDTCKGVLCLGTQGADSFMIHNQKRRKNGASVRMFPLGSDLVILVLTD